MISNNTNNIKKCKINKIPQLEQNLYLLLCIYNDQHNSN